MRVLLINANTFSNPIQSDKIVSQSLKALVFGIYGAAQVLYTFQVH